MRVLVLAAAFLMSVTVGSADAREIGHVYLLKGLANIFSTGLDNYAAALRARGIGVTVANHSEAIGLADEAARLQKSGHGPIVIVGHSLGASSSVSMAQRMNELGARVALIVNYGPPPGTMYIPPNVGRVVNYYGGVGMVERAPGSRASITNINIASDPVLNHFNMDKSPSLQAKTMGAIVAAVRGNRVAQAAPASSSAPAADAVH